MRHLLSHLPAPSAQGQLFGPVLDTLEDQICVIDQAARIVYVNRSWVEFGLENGVAAAVDWAGISYLNACNPAGLDKDPLADAATGGILDVLQGRAQRFSLEYPCHSLTVRRWFLMRMTPLQGHRKPLFLISHVNITQRKLAEQMVEALSRRDALTGLANRREFDDFLHSEWQRGLRGTTPLSLIMIDLDHFKHYNDTLGHPMGDQCLQRVGHLLLAACRRPSDLAVRFGGDEFTLVLGNTGLAAAMELAQAVRRGVSLLQLKYKGTRQVSASLGVASVVPAAEQSQARLIQAADLALYQAKRAGRDVCVSCVP